MREFRAALAALNPARQEGRRWLFVPYDQLSDQMGPLSREAPEELGIILIENPAKAARRPYHKQKLAYVLSNLRHFALEQAERGVAVRHLVGSGSYAEILAPQLDELGHIRMMEPAERELRVELTELPLERIPHEGWLTQPQQFLAASPRPPWRMDAFYRRVRQESGILMEKGKPVGGKYSFDPENRKPWKGQPPAPRFPQFPSDPIKEEVLELLRTHFSRHPGQLDGASLPATRRDAEQLWAWARQHCLPHFGPYEDAMSRRSLGLFHTRISALLNLHRLLPARVVQDVEAMSDLPLACREGFIRQVLGWREFVRHVHVQTDGLRQLPPQFHSQELHGDGGYSNWSGTTWNGVPAGASPSFLEAQLPLAPAFWGRPSGLACLDQVVSEVWQEGYSHHITRLMVLSNLATLLGYSPRQLTDWFWCAYIDAYDWVVEPNVLAMGTFAVGELMTTKPYVSGSAYIHKMSDYCSACQFDPKSNCPITPMYWAFLERHRDAFRGNQRMAIVMKALEKRESALKERDRQVVTEVRSALSQGQRYSPELL